VRAAQKAPLNMPTVAKLKAELRARALATTGSKAELVIRLAVLGRHSEGAPNEQGKIHRVDPKFAS
jgi:hypothetical protein